MNPEHTPTKPEVGSPEWYEARHQQIIATGLAAGFEFSRPSPLWKEDIDSTTYLDDEAFEKLWIERYRKLGEFLKSKKDSQ